MTAYRISEVADRTGFSPATLRYYEEIGVVPPPSRSGGGYRLYDERSLDRLTFVARAKQLGLSLEEVGDLAELWDGEECGPVQERMARFVARKLTETRALVAELTAQADQLEAVVARLAGQPQNGPCDDTCACNADVAAAAAAAAPAPVVCTLDPELIPGRVSDWEKVVARSIARERRDDGLRLRFPPDEGLAAELAALAQAEQRCCAFFDFTVGIGAGSVTLDVRAPAEALQMVEELFGLAS